MTDTSSKPDFYEGQKLLVEVDTVFDGGLVVSCKRKNSSYRGALLAPPIPFFLPDWHSTDSNLANPLSLVHDHPYAKLQNYAKHLANKIPDNVLLQWKAVPKVGETPSSTSMSKRRETLKKQIKARDSVDNKINGKFCKWRSSEKKRSPVKVPFPESATSLHNNSRSRQAKLLATDKIRKDVNIFNRTNRTKPNGIHSVQRLKQKSNNVLRAGVSQSGKDNLNSTSNNVERAMPGEHHAVIHISNPTTSDSDKPASPSDDYLEVSERVCARERKVLLKKLSIPLKKVNIVVESLELRENVANMNVRPLGGNASMQHRNKRTHDGGLYYSMPRSSIIDRELRLRVGRRSDGTIRSKGGYQQVQQQHRDMEARDEPIQQQQRDMEAKDEQMQRHMESNCSNIACDEDRSSLSHFLSSHEHELSSDIIDVEASM